MPYIRNSSDTISHQFQLLYKIFVLSIWMLNNRLHDMYYRMISAIFSLKYISLKLTSLYWINMDNIVLKFKKKNLFNAWCPMSHFIFSHTSITPWGIYRYIIWFSIILSCYLKLCIKAIICSNDNSFIEVYKISHTHSGF